MNQPILHEPDPLPALRSFAYLWLVLVLALMLGPRLVPEWFRDQWLAPQLYVIHALILAAYLSWRRMQRLLGRAFLPLALIFAAFGSQLILLMHIRLDFAAAQNEPGSLSNITGIAHWLLLWPTIAVVLGWKYRFIHVIQFAVALAIFSVATLSLLFYGVRPIGFDGALAFAFLSAAIITIGYFVGCLSRAEQQQRHALAEANTRLAQHAATIEQLAISRERNHLARELHDTLAHSLSSLAVQLETARVYWANDPRIAQQLLEQSLATTRSGLQETRRALQALRASPLEDLGLCLAIEQLAREAAERTGMQLKLQLPQKPPLLESALEQGIYRIAQEAIANVVKHAAAQTLCIELAISPTLCLCIRDDGIGMAETLSSANGHYGIQGMRERAAVLGADLTINSKPGQGTEIRIAGMDRHSPT